jgi:hypothetical protein
LVASLAVTLTIGITLGAVNLARLTGTWGFLSHPAVWTHGYAQTFGFFALFIMGFAYHAVPRFVAAPLAWPGLVAASLWLQVAGLLAVTLGWLFLPDEAHRLWIAGSLGFVLASGAFLAVILGTLHHRTRPAESFERWMTAGAVWLIAGSVLALRAALGDDVGWHHLLWPAMLQGFAGSWILGAGRRLFPISLGWRPRWPRLERPVFWLYQAGVAAWVVGAWPEPVAGRFLLRAAGAILLFLTVPVAAALLGLGGPRQPWAAREVDRDYERYVHAAWAWAGVSLVAGPLFTLIALARGDYGSRVMLDFAQHTFALGFATQLIMGIGGRFVPAFVGRRPFGPRAQGVAFFLLNLAVALRGLEAAVAFGWAEAWPWLGLSGPPAVVALAVFAVNVLAALRRPTLISFRPRPTPPIETREKPPRMTAVIGPPRPRP